MSTNPFFVMDGHAVLIINSPKHGRFEVLFDVADIETVIQHRWRVVRSCRMGGLVTWYAATNVANEKGGNGHTLLMHTLITGIKGVDHINNNGLDNRRNNLREACQVRNSANQRKGLNFSSKYKGVSWDKNREQWTARIGGGGRRVDKRWNILLGCYESEEDAARAYDAAAKEWFGKFAKLNLE